MQTASRVIHPAYVFFRRQGCTAQQALDLAWAEHDALAYGLTYRWEHDPNGVDWDDAGEVREVLCCSCYGLDGACVASLGGIADPDRNYGRIVEAELAEQAFATEERLWDLCEPGRWRTV